MEIILPPSIGLLDTRYLKLDCSSDPMTGDLDLNSHVLTANRIQVGNDWSVNYDANELPEDADPVWELVWVPDTAEIIDGKLHVVKILYSCQYNRYETGSGTINAMETRVKLVKGVFVLHTGNGLGYYFLIRVSIGSVTLYNEIEDNTVTYEMNTTSDYHTYRITTNNDIGKMYIDGVLRGTVTSTRLDFDNNRYGIYNDTYPAEYYVDYIYYQTDATLDPTIKATLNGNLVTADRIFTLPDASGTIALQEYVAANYLKLDASNDPLTGGLTIQPTVDTLTAFVVNDTDANNVLTVDTINNLVYTPSFQTPTINGGILANEDITIQGTTHATRTTSYVILQPNGGNVGIGTTSPTAKLHLPASTATANTASLKIPSGVVATTPVAGNIESDGTNLYWTDDGGTRRQLNN